MQGAILALQHGLQRSPKRRWIALERLRTDGPFAFMARIARLTRFSCLVVYREGATRILVVAVAHEKRKPGYWRKR